MSELRDILAAVVADRTVTTTGELCLNVRTGRTFTAEYQGAPPIELRAGLGLDPREAGRVFIIEDDVAAAIVTGQRIKIQLNGKWATFEVLQGKRENQPDGTQTSFGLSLVTNKDNY